MSRQILLILIGFFLFSSLSNAASIKQILIDENKAAVSITEGEKFSVGEFVLANYEQKNCSLRVEDVKQDYMIVDLMKCPFKQNLKNGDLIEKSFIQATEKKLDESVIVVAPEEIKTDTSSSVFSADKVRFGGVLYVASADTVKFDNVIVTTGTGATGHAEVNFNSSASYGIGLHLARIEPMQWGYSLGLNYEARRKIKSIRASGAGGTLYGSYNDGPKFSFVFVEANILYRWEKYYLPFGFNYSVPDIEDIAATKAEYSGVLGVNVGFAVLMSPDSAVEINYRSLALQINTVESGNTIDYGTGRLSGLTLGWKFFF